MRYRVAWEDECFRQLDAMIAAGASIEQLKQAVLAIDRELNLNPRVKGIPLSEGLFRIDSKPLRAFFHVDDASLEVKVDAVWWIEIGR